MNEQAEQQQHAAKHGPPSIVVTTTVSVDGTEIMRASDELHRVTPRSAVTEFTNELSLVGAMYQSHTRCLLQLDEESTRRVQQLNDERGVPWSPHNST